MNKLILTMAAAALMSSAAAQSTSDPTPAPEREDVRTEERATEVAPAEKQAEQRTTRKSESRREFSVARAFDPEGRKHWKRMNRRSTRAAKGSPPGTVPAH